MRRADLRLTTAALLAALMLLVTATVTTGYIEQRLSQVLLSGPNVVKCNRAATLTATVVATESGRPIANQIVSWSIVGAQSSGDGLNAASTITNRRGKTSVRLSFGPAAGPRTVRASAGGSAATITVRCAGGLPRTSTVPPEGAVDTTFSALLAPPAATIASDGTLPARSVRMERLGIDLPLVEGDGFDVPDGVASHYPGTAWPGEGSNTYLYGHAREGQFLELWKVRAGDIVDVDMADGTVASYAVTEVHPMVAWDAFEYLAPTDDEILTLQTCLTYESTAPRFVVIAERLGGA